MKYLLTGATGTIGVSLIRKLVSEDNHVYVLCNPDSKRLDVLRQFCGISLILCDMNDYASLNESELPDTWDCTINLAWRGTTGAGRNDYLLQVDNIRSAVELIELSHKHGCKCFVGAGSQAEYGRKETPVKETDAAYPENGYGAAKLSLCHISKVICEEYGMRFIWPRIFSVYGPYENCTSMTISSILKCLNNTRPSFTNAEQIWDYAYTDDVADAILRLINANADGVYNIGSGKPDTLMEYINKLVTATGYDGPVGFGDIPYSGKQVMYLCADISKLKKTIGECMTTPFEEGINKTVEWCRSLL